MRSPGVIYRRYRQIRKKILYDKLEQARQCKHCNCFYGLEVTYTDASDIEHLLKVCKYDFHLTEGHIEVCTKPHECTAYVNKWSKDKVVELVDKELSNHDIKKRLYPELITLEWALDKDLNEAVKNPGIFGSIIIRCIEILESILRNK